MKRNIILSIIIILVILLIVLIAVVISIPKEDNSSIDNNEIIVEEGESFFKPVNDYSTYYTIKNILNNYTTYIKHITGDEYMSADRLGLTQEEMVETIQNDGLTAIKSIIDPQYISDFGNDDNMIITKQQSYVVNGNYSQDVTYNITFSNLLVGNLKENIKLVLIDGKINSSDLQLIVKMDQNNKTYSIFYNDFIEKYGYNENTKKEEIQINDTDIQKNDYNGYIEPVINDEFLVKEYFSDYRSNMLYNTEQAYEMLDEEYRNSKFGNYEKFAEYVTNNKLQIQNSSIQGYQIENFDGIKEYVCIDQNDKYYIFTEDGVAKYDVILDTYTVALPDFLEEYNKSKAPDKAGMNLQRVVDALNNGDYEYVYNKMDETFRNNNFKTVADFEKYVKENFYTSNNVEFSNYKNSSDLYMFDAKFTDKNNSNAPAITKTFIIQLKEGTDYRMSFNVK